MRASTALDPLEPLVGLEANNSIPVNNQPWFSIGQVVKGVTWEYSSYYLGQLLKKSGKVITREILNLLQRGEQLEYSIAGIEAYYALPTIGVCNQCYLQNGQCYSGLEWHYKVLVKGVLDGNNVCVIPKVWICERDFIPLVEIEFEHKQFYKDNRNHINKCLIQRNEPVFIYIGFISKKDDRLHWDNHRTPRTLTPWQRRDFQPYTLPDNIRYYWETGQTDER